MVRVVSSLSQTGYRFVACHLTNNINLTLVFQHKVMGIKHIDDNTSSDAPLAIRKIVCDRSVSVNLCSHQSRGGDSHYVLSAQG